MPRHLDTAARMDLVVEAVVALVTEHGVQALTTRRIADRIGLSPSTLTSHLTNKQRILDLTLKRVGAALLEQIWRGLWLFGGMPAFVTSERAVPQVRAWLALSELARADDSLGRVVAGIEAELRAAAVHACGREVDDETVDLLLVAVSGLWTAMCRRHDPLSVESARAMVRRACERLEVPLRERPSAP